MATLVLDPQQSQLVSTEGGEILVVDDCGRRLGVLVAEIDDEPPPRLTAAQVELILERMKDPIDNLPTTAEVIERIKARAGQ